MGTPAVVYNIPGLRDSVKACQSGVVVKRNRPEALAEESLKLLKDNPRRIDLAQKALQEVKKLSWEKIYKSLNFQNRETLLIK